ncbi:presenilin family intramembrane aspartyl protease PSH [Halobacterium rubrum]|uniref:presenilin family intramembrane aspartyl protease PSH n=1 Tax=Halobacterium TaxID=2239 RepID=UPI001F466DEA|nr:MULTISPECIES: presenilin family intramembrane aspartyl protease PSH [Halobacterium]MDH5021259.1 presenilin family intramembrane aspartyl protease [Halobacterium rubrum]
MNDSTRVAGVLAGVVALFVVVQVGALALVEPFQSAGLQSTENPQNPLNSIFYVAFLLVATGGILLVIKYDQQWVLKGFILLTSGVVASYVFAVVFPAVTVAGVNLAVWVPAVALVVALYAYPEWWVIDSAGAIMGMGAAALFGISFGILPALVLLTALAVYDAISVYGTEHMLTLASGVMELRLPIVLVVPTTLAYSFVDDAEETADEADEGEREASHPADRPAYFIGLGDAVMPSILVASAAFFLDTPEVVSGVELAPLTAMVGTLLGLLVLMRLVFKGRAHAGLPLLNGGAIAGYLVGAVAAGIPVVEALGLAPYV